MIFRSNKRVGNKLSQGSAKGLRRKISGLLWKRTKRNLSFNDVLVEIRRTVIESGNARDSTSFCIVDVAFCDNTRFGLRITTGAGTKLDVKAKNACEVRLWYDTLMQNVVVQHERETRSKRPRRMAPLIEKHANEEYVSFTRPLVILFGMGYQV